MTAHPFRRLRGRLLLVALAPAAVAGVAAAGPGLPVVLAVGLVAAGVTGFAVWSLTRRLGELAAGCEQIAAGDGPDALPADGADEVGAVVRAVRAVDDRRQAAVAEAGADLKSVAGWFSWLSDPAAHPAGDVALTGLCPTEAEGATAAFRAAAKQVGQTRSRLNSAVRILNGVPAAVVAADESGTVRYLNPAAERLFGRSLKDCLRRPLQALVSATGADPLGREGVNLEAAGLANSTREVVGEVGGVKVGLTAGRPTGDRDLAWCLVARDLTAETAGLAADRGRTREEVLRGAWELAARAGGSAPDRLLAQARLLAGEAKQSGHRDVLLPRVATVKQEAAGLDVYFRTVRWLSDELWNRPPKQLRTEVMAGEVARAVADHLAPRFRSRNSTLRITDQGGWVCCDEEWLRTALVGLLAHACDATQDATVGLTLRRLPPAADHPEGRLAVEVVDAGPPLSADALKSLDAPFGGLDLPPLLQDEAGYLPGLLMARRVAAGMGGTVEFDTAPSGRMLARLILPTRLPTGPTERAVESDGDGPVEELCHGWKLGLPA